MWQGRWMGLAVAWLAGMAGALFLTPDRYEATARVYVDTQSMLKPLLQGLAVQPNVEQEVAILSRTLISRPNLQKLIRMTDMDLNIHTADEREKIIDGLTRILYIKSAGQNLYTAEHVAEPRELGDQRLEVVDLTVEDPTEPSSLKSGCWPVARSMIESRRWPRPIPASRCRPPASGPR
jgi:uncharacterized protein involved in exopolysaccharide biosynthesis